LHTARCRHVKLYFVAARLCLGALALHLVLAAQVSRTLTAQNSASLKRPARAETAPKRGLDHARPTARAAGWCAYAWLTASAQACRASAATSGVDAGGCTSLGVSIIRFAVRYCHAVDRCWRHWSRHGCSPSSCQQWGLPGEPVWIAGGAAACWEFCQQAVSTDWLICGSVGGLPVPPARSCHVESESDTGLHMSHLPDLWCAATALEIARCIAQAGMHASKLCNCYLSAHWSECRCGLRL
jgi:hypothetical protein